MLEIIKGQLLRIVDDIDAGNSNLTEEEEIKVVKALRRYTRQDKPMSKYQTYTYLNMSRAQFDRDVKAGKIPPGRKEPGFKELRWYKKDLPKPKK